MTITIISNDGHHGYRCLDHLPEGFVKAVAAWMLQEGMTFMMLEHLKITITIENTCIPG